jgi:hypothetical protein
MHALDIARFRARCGLGLLYEREGGSHCRMMFGFARREEAERWHAADLFGKRLNFLGHDAPSPLSGLTAIRWSSRRQRA